jgi:hypothetical protein
MGILEPVPEGTTHVMVVCANPFPEDTHVVLDDAIVNVTTPAVPKLVPVMVMMEPPFVGATSGEMLMIVGFP